MGIASRALWPAHRVVAPDLRGMGRSDVTAGPYLMESLAGDVAAVLDAIGIERATVVGHSLGGYVAMAFARMYAERVERLALVCSRLAPDAPEQAEARLLLADAAERESSAEPVVMAYVPRLLSEKTKRERPSLIADVEVIARRKPVASRRCCAEWPSGTAPAISPAISAMPVLGDVRRLRRVGAGRGRAPGCGRVPERFGCGDGEQRAFADARGGRGVRRTPRRFP